MAVETTETTVAGFTGRANLMKAVSIDPSTGAAISPTTKKQYTLLAGYSAIGSGPQVGPVDGGDYIWRVEATTWTGVTANLEFLKLDGVSWAPVLKADTSPVVATADASIGIGIAQGSIMRVRTSGAAPVNMNSALGGL
ncbi:hypothetical protein ASG25_10550 [Rhizobium sp. Leaf384]|uniref:hypothetical protein n=1 Tax=Rhizobium sp. Leaf384 TaxID=1736358 RepID=UPI000713648D|nr:hypothetical protein [Rhizobium sp. Leaf384]KQS79020.1 hypothetical protein ASG25_10550 [Rhizobium sp. Leaf384]